MRPFDAIEFAKLDDVPNAFVHLDCAVTDSFVLGGKCSHINVHAEPSTHGDACGKVQRPVTGMSNVTADRNRREEVGIVPLHYYATFRVRIIAGPELMEVLK